MNDFERELRDALHAYGSAMQPSAPPAVIETIAADASSGRRWLVAAAAGIVVCTGAGLLWFTRDADPSVAPSPSATSRPSVDTTVQPTIAPSTTGSETTGATNSLATTSTATTAPPTTTTAAPTTSDPGPLFFVDGALLGIAQTTSLADGVAALGVQPLQQGDPGFEEGMLDGSCTGTPDPWVLRSGGLTFVYEGTSPETAILSNWRYTGGPAAGYTEVVAPFDIRIGDPRSKVEQAHPDGSFSDDEIHVGVPFPLRFGIENGVVAWFGIVDCLFEGE